MSLALGDMADHVCSVVGVTDAASLALAKQFIRRRHSMLYDSQLWDDSRVVASLVAASPEVILPSWISKVLAVTVAGTDARPLTPEAVETLWQTNAPAFEETGELVSFSELPPAGTHTHPGGEKVTLVSSAVGDTGVVRLRGSYEGTECEESVTLSGTSPVTSVNNYHELIVSKPETTGGVTVAAVGGTEVLALLPRETTRIFQRVLLTRNFTEAGPALLNVLGKRTCPPLVHDHDTPTIPGFDHILIAYGVADMWERLRQVAKSQAKIQEAGALLTARVNQELTQKVRAVRLVPEVSVYA